MKKQYKQLAFMIAGAVSGAAFVGAILLTATMLKHGASTYGIWLAPCVAAFCAGTKLMNKYDF